MWFFVILILILAFLQASVTTLPLVLLFFLNAAVITKKTWVFPAAFLAGAVLDILLLNPLGKTSLFLVIFLFIILLYDKKFDIQTFPFIFLASFMGSFVYFIAFQISNVFAQALISTAIAALSFWILIQLNRFPIKGKAGFNET